MKSLILFLSGLALIPVLRADPIDNNPNIPKHGGRSAAVPQQQIVTPRIQPGNSGQFHRSNGLPGNPMRFYSQPVRQNQVQSPVQGHHRFQLSNMPNPKIASVKFRADNHIVGSEKWQGQHYDAFRSYHSQWHDHDWWRHHHSRIILIGGGWYFWDAGFWYPAWGYDPAYSYYPYDGPIYAYNDLPPDQVIANVQAALQDQGYYTGEVDGTLGPLTRAALAAYQRDHGLYTTGAIDQPTLVSLGMG